MKFNLVDSIIEHTSDRIVVVKQVTLAEEYLADHFPSFPVLPGVMMVETMAQAARQLLADHATGRMVLGEVKAMKFGNMVRPGERLIVEVSLGKVNDDGSVMCKGVGRVAQQDQLIEHAVTAVSGKFTMRPIRTA